jgi:hypothetical protein
MLGLFGPKSDKIELYRTAILYLDPLKESVSTESRVSNEVVLGTSVDKGIKKGRFSEPSGPRVMPAALGGGSTKP